MSDAERAEAAMNVAEAYAPIIELTAGHRAQLEAAGFSPTAAEMMAVDFHRSLMAAITQRSQQ